MSRGTCECHSVPSPVTLCALGVDIHVGVPSGILARLPSHFFSHFFSHFSHFFSHFFHAGLGARWRWGDSELSEEGEGVPRAVQALPQPGQGRLQEEGMPLSSWPRSTSRESPCDPTAACCAGGGGRVDRGILPPAV